MKESTMSFRMSWHDRELRGATLIIGIFDGVHRGHQEIIKRALDLGAPVVALTFEPHPLRIVAPERAPTELLPLSHKIDQLKTHGVASVAVIEFDAQFATMSPEQFVAEVLIDALDAKAIVVGDNFRFGHKASGNLDVLRKLAKIPVHGLDLASELGSAISSTRIRDAIVGGNIEIARELLTRPHQLSGLVIHGEKLGRAIGYPTANIQLAQSATIPSDGVYAGWLSVAGSRWPAAISIGTNPTFAGSRGRQLEAYALDQEGLELYDQVATVEFGWRLRDTIKFASLEALLAHMKIDCDKARELTRTPA